VVAQVRFSAIIAIEKYVPEIQEQLRHKGFPRFLKGQVHEIAFQADGAPKFSAIDRFEFQDKDASLGIVLQSNSVAVHTNLYSNYETSRNTLERRCWPSIVSWALAWQRESDFGTSI